MRFFIARVETESDIERIIHRNDCRRYWYRLFCIWQAAAKICTDAERRGVGRLPFFYRQSRLAVVDRRRADGHAFSDRFLS